MATCLGKSCLVGLLCVSCLNVFSVCVCACVCVCASFPFGFEDGMLDLIVLIPDHCLPSYF